MSRIVISACRLSRKALRDIHNAVPASAIVQRTEVPPYQASQQQLNTLVIGTAYKTGNVRLRWNTGILKWNMIVPVRALTPVLAGLANFPAQ